MCHVQGAKFQVPVNVLESSEISAGFHNDYTITVECKV